jgi:hypothetical protein
MATAANIVFGGATVTIGSDLGYIKDGLHLAKEEELYYTRVEGVPTPVSAYRTSLQYSMSGTLIEPTLANIALVFGCTDSTTPMSMGLANEMDIVNNSLEKAVSFTSVESGGDQDGDVRTIAAAKAVADGPGEMVFTDAEEVSLPFTFKVLWDTTGADQSIIITDA